MQTMSKRKKEQERNSSLIEKLQEERQRQEDNNRLVISWIKLEKDSWFNPSMLLASITALANSSVSTEVTKNRTVTQLLQLCIYPRCRFTASDAMYCAKFVFLLHTLHTPTFSTLLLFDRVRRLPAITLACLCHLGFLQTYADISYTVACCTENEARRYGQ